MKAVPILIVTNALALGLGLMAYLEMDDLKSQRASGRQDSSRVAAEGDDHLVAQITELKSQIARLAGERGVTLDAGTDAPATMDPGKAIDRSVTAPEVFDETVELARPDFDYFRERVRLAQDENQKEERITRQVERIDTMISENRIGQLSEKAKRQAAQTLVETSEKTRKIWGLLRTRPDLQNLPQEERRTAWRDAYRKEQDVVRSAAQKSLETIMPAADAESIMSQGGGGDFGMRTGRRGR
ncbi:MAG: hypothetical protein ACYS0F_06380 [Planctomycetota bacterium]|jgi:hypothetical protein